MKKTALVFPGQGSQIVGMGKELSQKYAEAKKVFQEVDDALGKKLSEIMFEGTEQELNWTVNAQPAIMALSMAFMQVIRARTDFNFSKYNVSFAAGHSLGEYSALCACGALSITDTAILLSKRAQIMDAAFPEGKGGMISLLGVDMNTATEIAQEASDKECFCEVSNDNSEGQIVLSGHLDALEKAKLIAKNKKVKRIIPLSVSGPFHSSLMKPALQQMKQCLDNVTLSEPEIPIVDNVIAEPVTDISKIKDLLLLQIASRVRWRESVLYMRNRGVERMLEIGGNGVLSKLKKRIAPDIVSCHIGNIEQLNDFLENGIETDV